MAYSAYYLGIIKIVNKFTCSKASFHCTSDHTNPQELNFKECNSEKEEAGKFCLKSEFC